MHYVRDLLHGNLQISLRTRHPVTTDLRHDLPATLELAIAAMLIASVLALILGVASAARLRGSGVFRFMLVGGGSVPAFLLALLGILLFYNHLHWLPAPGRTSYLQRADRADRSAHRRRPAARPLERDARRDPTPDPPGARVAIVPAVVVGRVLRSSITDALHSDYVRTARSKGLRERTVLLRHTLRNSVGAALSMAGLQVGLMFAGVMVVEAIFAWPGIGLYTSQSIPAPTSPPSPASRCCSARPT